MPKRSAMSRTSSTVSEDTGRRRLRVSAALLCALLGAQVPMHARAETSVAGLFAARRAALAALHLHDSGRMQTSGELSGLGLRGTFHSWHEADRERIDQQLGIRHLSTIRNGDAEYMVNASGDVRRINGLLVERQRTEDVVDSNAFLDHPEYVKYVGALTLLDGRKVEQIQVSPPHGQAWIVSLGATDSMIDQVKYLDSDRESSVDFYNYRVVSGALVAYRQTQSDGDRAYDITQTVRMATADLPIDPGVFTVPASVQIQTDKPLVVPLMERRGAYFVPVQVNGHDYQFLIDSGSQAVILDARIAAANLLAPQGSLEIAGTKRTRGLGVTALESLTIGGANLPVKVATIVDLGAVSGGKFQIDGILGYPFFAAAEVRIDPDRSIMTIAKPGALGGLGTKLGVDVDRELPEVQARVDGDAGRFLIDTGNGTELLVFHQFAEAHPGILSVPHGPRVSNYGVGGAISAVPTTVDEFDIAGFRLFRRLTNVELTDTGAFADRFNAGNIGLPTLKNFVTTFDLANGAMYLAPSMRFDDGRYRNV